MVAKAFFLPLIGVVHLKPLPASPRWAGSMAGMIRAAVADAVAYEQGGATAVTASVMESDRLACAAAGMDDFITKPIRSSDLREALKKWCGDGVAAG